MDLGLGLVVGGRDVEGSASSSRVAQGLLLGEVKYTPSAVPDDQGNLIQSPVAAPGRTDGLLNEVCLVLTDGASGELLIVRKDSYPSDCFRLPTGGVNEGEEAEAAAKREALEEFGVAVNIERNLAVIRYPMKDTTHKFATTVFLLSLSRPQASITLSHELTESRWIPVMRLILVAENLERLEGWRRIGQDSWAVWGRFRAVVHRVVHDRLMQGSGDPLARGSSG